MSALLDPLIVPPWERPRDWRGWWIPAEALDDCLSCGAPRERSDHANCGYCRKCYRRWADNGYPSGGPPAPRTRGPSDALVFAEFRRRYRTSATTALIRDLGISRRTAQRWKKKLAAPPGDRRDTADVLPNRRYAYSGRA